MKIELLLLYLYFLFVYLRGLHSTNILISTYLINVIFMHDFLMGSNGDNEWIPELILTPQGSEGLASSSAEIWCLTKYVLWLLKY